MRWLIAAAAIAMGWFAGLGFWGAPTPGFAAISDWVAPTSIAVAMFPLLVVAGGLSAARSRLRFVGSVALVLGTLAGTYLTSYSHFGGICVDPEDVCNVTWLSRGIALVTGLLCVAAGAGTEAWLRSRHRVR